jgi:hypothetical protein
MIIANILNKVSDNVEIRLWSFDTEHKQIDYLLNKSEHTNSEMHGYPMSPRKVQTENLHTYGRKLSYMDDNDLQTSLHGAYQNTPHTTSSNDNNTAKSFNNINNNMYKNNTDSNESHENIGKTHETIEHSSTSSKEEIDYGNNYDNNDNLISRPHTPESLIISRPSTPTLQNTQIAISSITPPIQRPESPIQKQSTSSPKEILSSSRQITYNLRQQDVSSTPKTRINKKFIKQN